MTPYRWLHCQQSLGLTDTQLRVIMMAGDADRQLLLHKQWAQFQQNLEDDSAAKNLRAQLERQDISLLSLNQPAYPALLLEISDPPPLLFCRGRKALFDKPCIALVGSRRPSRTGERDAEAFGAALAEAGFCVVSGMALGVDAAAHRGALKAGGSSLAVLGCGVDVPYPRSNMELYKQLAISGQILSEYPTGAPPLRHQFPRRNRLISGLSLGVLVVEAAERSGSLITARLALEQNREVFALPGSIHNPSSRGCNALIRQGAQLVETVAEIIEAFSGWVMIEPPQQKQEQLHLNDIDAVDNDTPENEVYQHLDFEPQTLESLAQKSELPIAELLVQLSQLEMAGWAEVRGTYWLRTR
ncbi:DNA-protecting protein DprA [Spongiibacter sp. KMU-158]|uniref:DNA-protecting protein DprA n=1 Tax=Spongiibacter pelagi TaxID=2760804 RepID=A0A927GV09_9GAMM|nr:DNA-processing protein DprA [Spongiibacter pelagi]MBD2857583.1 DNA-protecting protein DprA [Spongiibacter pelagi]